MYTNVAPFLAQKIAGIEEAGLFKRERQITSAQQAEVGVAGKPSVLNMCANNYLGLANHPAVVGAAREALDKWGYGLASVRFICGTQSIHKELEAKLSEFLGTEDTILYGSCFDANGGLFETLLEENDAVISDELNHASIIDGIRLCKAARFRYKNGDMADLEAKLREAATARHRLIATDGVFSMDGYIAKLPEICDLADKYQAMVMVDDSHAVGFMGKTGRGTHEHHEVMNRVDIITGTLGKALGGASGGYTSGRKEIIDLLRQRSRPYLFSNSVAPPIVAASLKVLELLKESTDIARPFIREHGALSAAYDGEWFSDCCRVNIRLFLLCLAMRFSAARTWRRRCWKEAFTWWDSRIRLCRRARHGFACRSQRATRRKSWILRRRNFWRRRNRCPRRRAS